MTVAATDARERIRARAAELLSHERWSREELLAYQRAWLRDLLAYAVERSPYYREVLGADAPEQPLDTLPTLPKAVLMENFDRVVTDERLRRADLEEFLEEADAGEAFLGEYRVFSTSGTSGIPGLFLYSHDELRHWISVALAALARVGVTAETRFVAIGAPSALHITRQMFAALQAGRTDVPRLSALTPMGGDGGRPQPLPAGGHPRLRERHGGAGGRAVGRPARDPAARRDLHRGSAHGGCGRTDEGGLGNRAVRRLREHRGGADRDGLARPRRHPRLGELARPRGSRPGRSRRSSPRAGEQGAAHEPRQPRRAAHPLRALGLDRPRGRARSERAAVAPDRGSTVAAKIVQRRDGLLVRVVSRADAGDALRERVAKAVGEALAGAGAHVPVRVETVPEIEREPGPAAKVKLVRSRL